MRRVKFNNGYKIFQYAEVDLVEQLNKEYLQELANVKIFPLEGKDKSSVKYVVLEGNKLYFYLPPANSEWFVAVLGLLVKLFKEFPEWRFRISHYQDKIAERDFYICVFLTPLT